MPRNSQPVIKPAEYNPDYFPRSSEKPLIFPDSSGEYLLQKQNEWGLRYSYTCTVDSVNNGMPEHLISSHSRKNDQGYYLTNGIFIVSIMLLFAFASIRIFYAKALWGISKAVFNYQWAVKAYEERNSLLERVYLVLDIIFLFNASLSVFLVSDFFFDNLPYSTYIQIAISAGFVLVIYFSRILLIWVIAFLTKETKIAGEFLMVTNIFYKAAGIILFLPVFLFNYISETAVPALSVITIIILFSAYILTIIRGLYFAVKRKFYFYYYLLYLCAVEIIPLLLTTKMVMLTNGI